MAESDGEIEYLEEDAEIVQQCVQKTQKTAASIRPPSLLIERPRSKPVEKRKRKKEEDDSDYDPTEEVVVKKKQPPQKRTKILNSNATTNTFQHNPKAGDYHHVSAREQYLNRKKLNIRIPDYDDPLCLPVRAIRANESDKKRLNNWNKVCLEHYKHCDEILKPERGETKKSFRTAVFKNVVNKLTGTVETTIWSKTSVENVEGDKKSEIFQCVLPRYKEKKVLNNYILGHRRVHSKAQTNEAILSKEDHKDGEALVVYKPKESLSAIYRMIDKRKKDSKGVSERLDDTKMYLRELACCKICATCFQGSWRGLKKHKNKRAWCPLCPALPLRSGAALLSHTRSHAARDRHRVSALLADLVSYHYTCRICGQTCNSVKSLRAHTPSHQSPEIFKCEVGNHLVNVNVKK